jgi:glyceraldehyde 3-phosphate dehydrogenase
MIEKLVIAMVSASDDDFAKLISWYDNECGYATKMVELACYMNGVDNAQ